MGFKKFVKGIFNPQPPIVQEQGEKKQARNKASLVIDEIVYAFEESVKAAGTSRSLICHTAYVAYVPSRYYRDLQLTFGIITKEIVDIFHERINAKLSKNPKLKFSTPYNFWSFDLISLDENCSDIPDPDNPDSIVSFDELEENFVAVRSTMVPNDMFDFESASDDDSIRTNRAQPNSTFNRIQALSIGAIRGLKPSGQGYMYPIDPKGDSLLNTDARTGSGGISDTVLAVLEAADFDIAFTDRSGNMYPKLDIKLNDFYIGGPSASYNYNGLPLVHLNSEAVMSPHLEIRRDTDGSFYLRPLGAVELNGLEIKRNKWARLSDRNSSIKINGEIELTFNRKI
ncbi:MAG: hypothetical protein NC217_06155 [Muribaculaceae bacterium]|nr:hypothetical protein [Muribaculaceae bacterium]